MNERELILECAAKRRTRNVEAIRSALRRRGVSLRSTVIREALGGRGEAVVVPAAADRPAVVRGFNLANMPVRVTKPADTFKGRVYGLRRGMGFAVKDLAEEWGVSEDTVRTRAKAFDCLRYVEISPGQWVQCVLHPETAAEVR